MFSWAELAAAACAGITLMLVAALMLVHHNPPPPAREPASAAPAPPTGAATASSPPSPPLLFLDVTILYASTTGTAARFASELRRAIFRLNAARFHVRPHLVDAASFDPEDLPSRPVVIILMPTWSGGSPPVTGRALCDAVRDWASDFRVGKEMLATLKYAVFALGNSNYDAHWGAAGAQLDADLSTLSGVRMLPLERGDDSVDMDAAFQDWAMRLLPQLCAEYARVYGEPEKGEVGPSGGCGSGGGGSSGLRRRKNKEHAADVLADMAAASGSSSSCGCGGGSSAACGCGADSAVSAAAVPAEVAFMSAREYQRWRQAGARASAAAVVAATVVDAGTVAPGDEEEDAINDRLLAGEDSEDGEGARAPPAGGATVTDVEDLGAVMASAAAERSGPPRDMVTAAQRRALTKEGYKIIGTHSAVKLCRWTKAQLRGRGGCYKHTFYGITSYLCMEATPSLACANKCVFCWRHHKNPVGKEWRWSVDSPAMIVDTAVARHRDMIHELRGLPGLQLDRWNDAHTPRHCALSLVGEPIMYPHINDLIRLLHDRRISSFLVTNAQFPECITKLGPVTQLYVSIDAATRDTLKAIDRPLFADFWERFLASLDALRDKRQRTVYRLTLLKGAHNNMDDMDEYARLVARGQPDLIEVKGVTYCGTSPGSSLTMKDVPWHHEVKAFCETLCDRLGGAYACATEHAHSCCVLLAKTSFRLQREGDTAPTWYTHIDYDRFHELVQAYYTSGGSATFGTMDYIARTPAWALYGAPEAGFDPVETRWYRNKAGVVEEAEYKPSESGCG